MAKETAKKNARKNEQRLLIFLAVTLAINALHLIVGSGFGVPSFSLIFTIAFWFGQEYAAYTFLKARGAPDFSNGEIADCADLSDPEQLGIYSYAQDLLWVCWGVQFLSSCVSAYFVVLYLPVPIFALYKAWGFVIGPLLSSRFGSRNDAGNEKTVEDDARTKLRKRREQLRGKGSAAER